MAKRKARSRAKKQTKAKLPDAVLKSLYQQRERVFQAQGIVSCARFASDSAIVGEPNIVDGLKAACEMLDDVAEALELLIADESDSK